MVFRTLVELGWRDHMAATLRDGGYKSCKADTDVWMHPKTKPDGFKYWSSYILVYTDDILVVDNEPKVIMNYLLASRYTLKPGNVKEPTTYLGAQVSKFYIDDMENPEKPHCAMSLESFVKQAVIGDIKMELGRVDHPTCSCVMTLLLQG
jgi:hypothetical protein